MTVPEMWLDAYCLLGFIGLILLILGGIIYWVDKRAKQKVKDKS